MSTAEVTASDTFNAEMRHRAPHLGCRAEQPSDRDFARALFVACSPLAGMAPDEVIAQQAGFQHAAHRSAYPNAMRRIVSVGDRPIGRVMIDWTAGATHLVDIAVLPQDRGTRAGRHMLQSWLAIADAQGLAATLQVRHDNGARRIYTDLGFVAQPASDPYMPTIDMHRPPSRDEAAGARR